MNSSRGGPGCCAGWVHTTGEMAQDNPARTAGTLMISGTMTKHFFEYTRDTCPECAGPSSMMNTVQEDVGPFYSRFCEACYAMWGVRMLEDGGQYVFHHTSAESKQLIDHYDNHTRAEAKKLAADIDAGKLTLSLFVVLWPMYCAARKCERAPFPTTGYCSKACEIYTRHEAKRWAQVVSPSMIGRVKIRVPKEKEDSE